MGDEQNRLSWPGESAPAARPWNAEPASSPSTRFDEVDEQLPAFTTPSAADGDTLTELIRGQKHLRLDLAEIGDAVRRLAEQGARLSAGPAPAVGGTAGLERELAELREALSRLTEQTAQTGGVLADVLRALAAETKARNDDMRSVRELLDKLMAQGA